MSGGEVTGTSLPVWQTLKGLSSRDACHSPTSPGLRPALRASTSVAERLARRGSCPPVTSLVSNLAPALAPALAPVITPAISPAITPSCSPRDVVPPKLVIPEGDVSGGLYNGSVASPISATGEEGGGRVGWGPPSSSTTSTSLSNANLALQHHNNKHVVSNNSLSFAASPKEERGDETPSVFR
ncbi:hypothetical protein Pmani_030232 [Petrolisthes manimaculis]|uniref:Uncharacterized protein n=1 Tax=Petrolisthes manimaculis TaxID=1843537 RepID=A0AAE1NYA9_9EUCA|nr:hypothetical protein Pmani_030232 [Petrolisthes manimaculis]